MLLSKYKKNSKGINFALYKKRESFIQTINNKNIAEIKPYKPN